MNKIELQRNKIIEIVMNNKSLNSSISKMVSHHYVDDFKSHFYLQLLNMDINKLNKAYKQKYLERLCYKVIRNQYFSKSSSFWKLYRNSGFWKEYKIDDDVTYLDKEIDIDMLEESNLKIIEIVELIIDDTTINRSTDNIINTIIEDVKDILRHIHWYDAELFNLYYIQGYNYSQIENKIGIKHQRHIITKSIKKTLDIVKKNIIEKYK